MKQFVVFLILVILSIYPIYRIPSVRYEIEEIQYFIKGEKRAKDDTNDLRYRITSSSILLAKQINPVIGTGIGDTQNDLNSVYLEKGYDDLLLKKHDTHNQYLSMLLGVGIIGLLGLLLQLLLLSHLFFKERQVFALWIICFFMAQMLTETILERQIPVILFSLFVSFMLFLLPGDYTECFFKNKIKKSLKL